MQTLTATGLTRQGLRDTSFDINAKDRIALTGPSGSGKTLLLRSLADLDPHQGNVTLDGTPCSAIPAPLWRRRVGYLAADAAWWADSVGECLPEVAGPWLAPLGFGDTIRQQPLGQLSSGERQRLALARLLANEPELLLLDEPTAHLDETTGRKVEQVVLDYLRERPTAVLWVTHAKDQVDRIATRHWQIDGGRLTTDR